VDPSLSRVHLLPVPDSLPRHLSEAASAQLEAYVQARLSLYSTVWADAGQSKAKP
jgi:hypothetical protein